MATPSDSNTARPRELAREIVDTSLLDDDHLEIHDPENPSLAQPVTILMSVAVTTSDDRLQIMPPEGSSQATGGTFIAPIDNVGDRADTTAEDLTSANINGRQPPRSAEANRAGGEALDDAAAAAEEEETRSVDLGWGIVVGDLSHANFNETLSFPKLFDT